MCKQVSRLGFILPERLPIPEGDSGIVLFRQLHGYWDSPEFSSAFPRRGRGRAGALGA